MKRGSVASKKNLLRKPNLLYQTVAPEFRSDLNPWLRNRCARVVAPPWEVRRQRSSPWLPGSNVHSALSASVSVVTPVRCRGADELRFHLEHAANDKVEGDVIDVDAEVVTSRSR